MSTAAMRFDVDPAEAPALRLSIAAAMVIAIPVRKYPCKGLLNFFLQATFAKKCQQRVMTIEPWWAAIPRR
jgi:hypothetical protein